MGVKSIHYYKNNVIIENSLNKGESDLILYDALYNDVDKLDKLISISKEDDLIKFIDLHSKGFLLKKEKNLVKVNSVKKTTFVQKTLEISNDNNIEIQIYHNINDIKNIISSYCNDVISSFNSINKKYIKVNKKYIKINMGDIIGTIKSNVLYEDYDRNLNELCNTKKIYEYLIEYGHIKKKNDTNIKCFFP